LAFLDGPIIIQNMTHQKYKNILIIQPMVGIGDMLWFLPHMRAIADHFSEGAITLLCRPSSQAKTLFQEEPCIKQIIPLYKKQLNKQGDVRNAGEKQNYDHDGLMGLFKLARDIRHHKYDGVWVLARQSEYVYAAKLAGIPAIHGYGYGLDTLLIQKPGLPKEYRKTHARDRATHLLAHYNIDTTDYEYPMALTQQAVAKVNKTYPKKGKWVCVGIGASEAEKKWPVDSFAQVISQLAKQGMTIFICGGPAETNEAQAIKSNVGTEYQNQVHCITDWSVMESSALASQCDLYLGNDTFLYNLAALQGIPSYCIAGEVTPHLYLKTMDTVRNKNGVLKVSPQMVLDKIPQVS